MSQRTTKNAILGGGFLGALVAWLGPVLLKAARLGDAAIGLAEFVRLFDVAAIAINWSAVYFFASILTAAGLVAVNFDIARKRYVKWARRHERNWDMPICEAIDHIARETVFSEHWSESVDGTEAAAKQFAKAAQSGRLLVKGHREPDSLPEIIPAKVWGRATLDAKDCNSTSEDKIGAVLMRRHERGRGEMYFGMVVDKQEILKIWPVRFRRRKGVI